MKKHTIILPVTLLMAVSLFVSACMAPAENPETAVEKGLTIQIPPTNTPAPAVVNPAMRIVTDEMILEIGDTFFYLEYLKPPASETETARVWIDGNHTGKLWHLYRYTKGQTSDGTVTYEVFFVTYIESNTSVNLTFERIKTDALFTCIGDPWLQPTDIGNTIGGSVGQSDGEPVIIVIGPTDIEGIRARTCPKDPLMEEQLATLEAQATQTVYAQTPESERTPTSTPTETPTPTATVRRVTATPTSTSTPDTGR